MKDSTYQTLLVSQLVENSQNRRSISKENFRLLVEKLQLKRQFKPLLVTPTDTEVEPKEYMVLAGNHRLKAYKELAVESVWVSVLEFNLNDDGLWHVMRDGVEETERFNTKEDAMLDWALSDNEEFAENDWDQFVNDMDGYSLDWNRYLMSDRKPKTVAEKLKDFLMSDSENKDDKEYKAKYQVVVDCTDESEQQDVFAKLHDLGIKCKILTI